MLQSSSSFFVFRIFSVYLPSLTLIMTSLLKSKSRWHLSSIDLTINLFYSVQLLPYYVVVLVTFFEKNKLIEPKNVFKTFNFQDRTLNTLEIRDITPSWDFPWHAVFKINYFIFYRKTRRRIWLWVESSKMSYYIFLGFALIFNCCYCKFIYPSIQWEPNNPMWV